MTAYNCLTSEQIFKKICELNPDKNKAYCDWNDISNARLFTEIIKGEARYVPEVKSWYIYDGVRWKEDKGNLRVMRLMQVIAEQIGNYIDMKIIPEIAKKCSVATRDEIDSFKKKSTEKLKIKKMWTFLKNRKNYVEDASNILTISFSEFDSNKYIFNVQNGTLLLKKNGSVDFRDHNPEDYCTKVANVEYTPRMIVPRWDKFIEEIMEGNTEKIHFLQKVFGYCLSGDTRFECFFMFLGITTRNGKSTLMDTALNMFGDYGTTANADTIMQTRQSNSAAPSEDLARLAGIRFLNVPEPAEGMTLNVAIVKQITGNDMITARFLHQNSFTYLPSFKFILATNHAPTVNDQTIFSSDRINVITFNHHFSEEERDTSLKELFASEAVKSTVLNWMLEGWFYLCKESLYPAPDCVKLATAAYKDSQNKIHQFIEECFEKAPELAEKSKTAYEVYRTWNFNNGYRPLGKSKWIQAMEQAGYHFEKRRTFVNGRAVGNATTMLVGLRFNEDFTSELDNPSKNWA